MGVSNMIIIIALLVNIILRTSKPNSSHCKSQPSEQKISPLTSQNQKLSFWAWQSTGKEPARGVPAVKNYKFVLRKCLEQM